MSTEDQNRCVVTLKKGIDTDKFMEDMKSAGYELHNEKKDSISNFDYVLSKDQATSLLSTDDRIIDIRYGSKKENGFLPVANALQEIVPFHKDPTIAGANWGLPASSFDNDPWGGLSVVADLQVPFTLTGKDVDIVIMDSGMQPDHPEWKDTPLTQLSGGNTVGTTRYQTVDWPVISGQQASYTQHAQYHRDLTGHGTHVAGIAAGKLNGWAKEANLYSLKILDDPTTAFGVSAAFNMLRHWHASKKAANTTNDSVPNIPTICNMSWGYVGTNTRTMTGLRWRNNNFSGSNGDIGSGSLRQYGLMNTEADNDGYWRYPVRIASVESDIQDCIDAGIILVGAAGNYTYQVDLPGGIDYDNYFLYTGWDAGAGNLGVPNQVQYYHRGATPVSQPGVICVGAIDTSYTANKENIATYSNRGPRLDVLAPGSGIMSAISQSPSATIGFGSIPYTLDTTYLVNKLNGTSMAAPQVTGIVTLLMGLRHNLNNTPTKEEALEFITSNAELNRMHDATTGTASTDYQASYALHGAPNRFLKQPFNSRIAARYGSTI